MIRTQNPLTTLPTILLKMKGVGGGQGTSEGQCSDFEDPDTRPSKRAKQREDPEKSSKLKELEMELEVS